MARRGCGDGELRRVADGSASRTPMSDSHARIIRGTYVPYAVLSVAGRHAGQHRAARIALMYPLVESAHVLTLCMFLGMAIMLDLRLLGMTLRQRADHRVQAPRAVDVRRVRHHGDHRRAAVLRDPGAVVPEHLVPHQGDRADARRAERLVVPRRHRRRVAEWDLAPIAAARGAPRRRDLADPLGRSSSSPAG